MSRCCAKEATDNTPDKTELEYLEFLESTTDVCTETHSDLLEEDELHMLEELFALFHEEVPIPDHIRGAIGEVHNSSVGHCGVRRTEARLNDMVANAIPSEYMERWKLEGRDHQREWVNRFIKECPFCQKQSYKKPAPEVLKFTMAQTQRVMQRLDLDFIGPIKEDAYGYKFILTIVDSFSRWVRLKTPETS